MYKLLLTALLVLTLNQLTPTKTAAQTLQKYEHMGSVHFGTVENPNLCCNCKKVLKQSYRNGEMHYRYKTYEGTFFEEPAMEVYQSVSGGTWYCPAMVVQGGRVEHPSCAIVMPLS